MKAIFANDTSGTSNPGCQGTVHHLKKIAEANGATFISHVPVGYAYGLVRSCYTPSPQPSRSRRLVNRALGVVKNSIRLNGSAEYSVPQRKEICPDRWQTLINRLADQLNPLWTEAEMLVVNGEGTIHDDAIGALALVALCAAARKLEKRVALVNCSIFDLSEIPLRTIRDSVDYLTVREPISLRYLASHGITAVQAADCLFLEGASGRSEWAKSQHGFTISEDYAVYTPGVLAAFGQVSSEKVAGDILELRRQGLKVLYYVVEIEDEKLAGAARAAGATVLPLGSVPWKHVFTLLSQAKLVMSGRYHINIFAALSGTPFIAMETNTKKMAGLFELLDLHNTILSSPAPDTGHALCPDINRIEHCYRLASEPYRGLLGNSNVVAASKTVS